MKLQCRVYKQGYEYHRVQCLHGKEHVFEKLPLESNDHGIVCIDEDWHDGIKGHPRADQQKYVHGSH